MSNTTQWFERKFGFSFSADLYPNLCIRLRGTPARIEELLRDRPHHLLIRRNKEKWSAQEQLGHLLDLEPLWSARVDDFIQSKKDLSPADLQNRKTHEANHNARNSSDLLRDFRSARTALAEKLATLRPEQFAQALIHPRLKQPMRLVDHLYFVAEHDDHHLAKIWSDLRS
ncbi:MAG: DinB family protein [Acidobacteria bacterium]|nr:DinB family protein [Acidobacteriota bacterium]MBS1865536.1 DinB family protein [Acidobacteriota bacterium]